MLTGIGVTVVAMIYSVYSVVICKIDDRCIWGKTTDLPQVNSQPFSHIQVGTNGIRSNTNYWCGEEPRANRLMSSPLGHGGQHYTYFDVI